MSTCKYIAAGFMNDATKLFNDFAKCHDNNFTTFNNLWKEHKFVHVFMGRPDYKEFREFVSEIYQLILDYMMSSSTESQIAAIYLLYALYRNQDVITPVKIRIILLQYQAIQKIHFYALKKKIRTALYIIDYLKKNCFELVANGSLYGPCCSQNKDTFMKPKRDQVGILSDLKQDMTLFQESNIIQNLKKMHTKYMKQKDNIMPASTTVMDKDSDSMKNFEKFDYELEVLIRGRRLAKCRNPDNSVDIGTRRAQLKKNSFKRRALFRYLNYEEEEAAEPEKNEAVAIRKKRQYKKRAPPNQRRVGRPRKKPVDDESSEESEASIEFIPSTPSAKGKRGPIGRRKVSYLKKHEGPPIVEVVPKKEIILHDQSDEYSSSSSQDSSDVDDLKF